MDVGSDGIVYAVGYDNTATNGLPGYSLLFITDQAAQKKTTTLRFGEGQLHGVCAIPKGGAALVGRYGNTGLVHRVNKDGSKAFGAANWLREHAHPSNPKPSWHRFNACVADPDGTVYAAGQVLLGGKGRPWFAKVGVKSNAPVFSQLYDGVGQVHGIVRAHDGGFYLGGEAQAANGLTVAVVRKTSATGIQEWSKELQPGNVSTQASSLAPVVSASGLVGLIGAGWQASGSARDAFVMRTDLYGNGVCATGCAKTATTCDDKNACTADSCEVDLKTKVGKCGHKVIKGLVAGCP